VTGSHAENRLSVAAVFTPRRTSSRGMLSVLAVVQLCVCTPVEAPLWCSRRCYGEVIPRPRLVGRAGTAPPCRPGMHLGDW
jgi:hypothetical protein